MPGIMGLRMNVWKGCSWHWKNAKKNFPIANRSLNLLRVNIQLTALLQMKGLQMWDPHNFFKECLWMHHLRKVKKNQKLTVLHPDIWHGGLELINVNVQCGRAHWTRFQGSSMKGGWSRSAQILTRCLVPQRVGGRKGEYWGINGFIKNPSTTCVDKMHSIL